jgi:hypothetical protein
MLSQDQRQHRRTVGSSKIVGDIGFHVFAKVPINNCAMGLPPIDNAIFAPLRGPATRGDFACSQLSTIM